ncbi:hypothetical protein HYDPIDRAFT_34061 [Hydnomerulius pinastri MD-312]|uniref:Uncharacterized protein n=1 Tax=Hydnomerulius pinastri MD-312 TaxID=994086 RepID=A0A0C9VYU1_9AGAM|nr:hypothetical protein HYDPIDRAFT_34061 [Hydnomerulius pinastri MD-312]
MQQQQQIIIAQQRQEQQGQQMLAQQQAQGLRHQTSRDRLAADKGRPASPSPSKTVDPAEATETKKLTVTPSIARDGQSRQAQAGAGGPLLPPRRNRLGYSRRLSRLRWSWPRSSGAVWGASAPCRVTSSCAPPSRISMNDFSDDSAVKFYLNKRGTDSRDSALTEEDEGDDTLYAETSRNTIQGISTSSSSGVNVTPDRFSSPSFRFALQRVIFPEDLPDDMVFDSLTEAIVFKNTLRDRTTSTSSISSGVSQSQRRKVFTFPKNVTVAEVIERGLERFGILEGVVDGGDEVEDKLTKRRSSTKVRYWLTASIGG